jgi:hypothetical protein
MVFITEPRMVALDDGDGEFGDVGLLCES